jgi:hypothetical protein
LDLSGDLGAGERDLLVAVNDWLREVPDPSVVPVRERSWEILHDEKALERARRGRLFGPGRLTDRLLAIEPALAPIEMTRHGQDPGSITLIVENWTTYRTLGWAAHRSDWSGTDLWGAGNQAMSRVEAAADVIDQPAQVRYFGDIDVAGLRLARDVSATRLTVGWPGPAPAVGLYRLLPAAGDPIFAQGRVPKVPTLMSPVASGYGCEGSPALRLPSWGLTKGDRARPSGVVHGCTARFPRGGVDCGHGVLLLPP